jgi:hypothetical protein
MALPALPAPVVGEVIMDELTTARNAYREARENVDLYDEALKARPYIAALERENADLKRRLAARRSGW